jgi:hypothetical protein
MQKKLGEKVEDTLPYDISLWLWPVVEEPFWQAMAFDIA